MKENKRKRNKIFRFVDIDILSKNEVFVSAKILIKTVNILLEFTEILIQISLILLRHI